MRREAKRKVVATSGDKSFNNTTKYNTLLGFKMAVDLEKICSTGTVVGEELGGLKRIGFLLVQKLPF